jgi:hypothetical protein
VAVRYFLDGKDIFCAKLNLGGTHRRCVCWMDYRDLIGALRSLLTPMINSTHIPLVIQAITCARLLILFPILSSYTKPN